MDNSEVNSEEQQEDLSITLLERRKRLHVLATEINNWENEASPNPNYLETISTPPQHTNAPSTSILSFDRTTPTNNYYSPKNFNLINKSPAMPNPSPQIDKENRENTIPSNSSPTKRKLTESHTSSSALTSSEILNVAHRILNKNQSNSAMCPQSKILKTNSNSCNTNFNNNQGSFSASSALKDIRSKFENSGKKMDNLDSSIMTPKSIIKKFEQMSRDFTGKNAGSHSNPISAQTSQISLTKTSTSSLDSAPIPIKTPQTPVDITEKNTTNKVSSIFPSLKSIQTPEIQNKKPPKSNQIYEEHIHPQSIIQKFEQMVKNNGQKGVSNGENIETIEAISLIPKSISNSTNFSTNTDLNRGSLTYISSVVDETSPRTFEEDDEDEDEDEEDDESYNEEDDNSTRTYRGNHTETDELYEDFGTSTKATYSNKNEGDSNNTSLFEDDEDMETDSRTENGETSLSPTSSYSGSYTNKEFDDINGEDMTNNDSYSEYTETETYEEQNYDITSTIGSYSPTEKEFNRHHVNIEPVATNLIKNNSIPQKTASPAIIQAKLKSPARKLSVQGFPSEDNQEPLFSIKEYRKQKKHAAAGLPSSSYRRSSISNLKNKEVTNSAEKAKKITKKEQEDNIKTNSNNAEDALVKKTKYLERIKELDELIKQEDNIIHQTGIALERCLTDTLFTGSSEHIECNRILLISCQKRQAYSSEINRLKQLINILVNKKPVQQVQPPIIDEYSGYADISPIDLTGLLIFSDLQLPIKESYLNKLKSGDEKRIFYFLCLIRNGIQVLQTQVISVQELIATRDTSITFPNRMAISNVDVNFKVKIDIYTLEITPKEVKHNKSTSLASTSKFFSPFKNGLFHSHHDSNVPNTASNSNHHYNEQSNLGVSTGGAKTSNFIHIDTIEITNKDLSSNRFKLSISSSSIPLTGVLFVTVRCMPSKSIELKGFMTLLEDVNGLRSWDRRWCFLNNYNISYWKYPEDEYKQSPLGIINLTRCSNEKVAILPRDICARKYTFELAVNEPDSNDKETINNKRYRLSADTKDQANDWLTNVNYALANLKLWNPKSNKAIKK